MCDKFERYGVTEVNRGQPYRGLISEPSRDEAGSVGVGAGVTSDEYRGATSIRYQYSIPFYAEETQDFMSVVNVFCCLQLINPGNGREYLWVQLEVYQENWDWSLVSGDKSPWVLLTKKRLKLLKV